MSPDMRRVRWAWRKTNEDLNSRFWVGFFCVVYPLVFFALEKGWLSWLGLP